MAGYYQHPRALVESDFIGEGTRIWAFTHILPGATIGTNCTISDHCYIEGNVRIGDNVTIKTHVAIPDGVVIEDDVFVGPNATFMNDRKPRSRNTDWRMLGTRIMRGATVGASGVVLCGVDLGRYCFVAAGAVVTRDVPDHALVMGNPGRLFGFVCRCRERLVMTDQRGSCTACSIEYRLGASGAIQISAGAE